MLAPALTLTGTPSTVQQNPQADPSCQWVQQVILQEKGGFLMQLTKLTLDSTDVTSQIQQLFGTTRIAPPKDVHAPQRLGDPNNLQDKGYANDVPEGSWLRGGGGKAGEGKPGYDPGHRAPAGDEVATGRKSPRDTWYKVPGNKKLRDLGDY